MAIWNPWHGCKKISPGCANCYVYRRDAEFGKDSRKVVKTANFDLPRKKDRKKQFKLQPDGEPVYTCMTSDFFVAEADIWRSEAWQMIRERMDLNFVIITKRIDRFEECIPSDWGDGYENVTIMCTCENQHFADVRLPIFLAQPIKHRAIIHEPMLEAIHIESYLSSGLIDLVTCGGESGPDARVCDYKWILETRDQCKKYGVGFYFKQTGAVFRKGDKTYQIDRKYQMIQAEKSGISFQKEQLNPLEDLLGRLARSKFRSRFHLSESEIDYINEKGLDVIKSHAEDFVSKRLAPAEISNDGKQTPMHGHPVFLAQHGTATCCRGCLQKWHSIPSGKQLTKEEQQYVVNVIMKWIEKQVVRED